MMGLFSTVPDCTIEYPAGTARYSAEKTNHVLYLQKAGAGAKMILKGHKKVSPKKFPTKCAPKSVPAIAYGATSILMAFFLLIVNIVTETVK